jgi:CRISPR-associated protein Csh1
MFQRLYDLSSLFPSQELWQRINEGMPSEYNRAFALCFSKQGQWQTVQANILSEHEFHDKIIYRSGPANGTDLTPCCKLASNTAERLLKAVKNLANYSKLSEEQRQQLQASIKCFETNQAAIWQQVETEIKLSGIDGKAKRGFIYWQIDTEPVFNWVTTKEFLAQQFLQPFAKGGTRIGTCSVCGQLEQTVYGNFNVLACYNLDKRGSIAGGFLETAAHRNFPVCQSCAFAIAKAFTFAENHLTSQMAGQSYLILPYASTSKIRKELHETFRENPQRFQLQRAQDLVSEEMEWLNEFSKLGDQIAFTLIFFKAENAAWRIQGEVQQVLPSRMHKLHRAVKTIAAAEDLATDFEGKHKPLHISALTFKQFSSGSFEKDSADTLRAWLAALFESRSIDNQHFLHKLVTKIISTGKTQPEFYHWIIRQAWGFYRYAILTGLISIKKTPESNMNPPHSAYGRYIQEHADFFSNPEKIVAFLTGCYAATVAATQKKERDATPFTKKFMGRLLSKKRLQDLYRDGHDKLAQYDKLGYVIKGLDPDLAEAWVACGEQWDINDEEATFAFVIGYSLEYRIKECDKAQQPASSTAKE